MMACPLPQKFDSGLQLSTFGLQEPVAIAGQKLIYFPWPEDLFFCLLQSFFIIFLPGMN
jgi:hypothetical protein